MTHTPYKPTPVVMEMNDITFHGNIVPLTWFEHLRYADGKPNLPAIIILSDIVYWYRPQEVRDERTGNFVGFKSKFKGDMLQMSYDQFCQRFGFTKKQVKDAVNTLIDEGLLIREFRTIPSATGALLGNVMFIEVIPSGIRRINKKVEALPYEPVGTYPLDQDLQVHPYEPVGIPPIDPQVQTLTENTKQEITTKINLTSMHANGENAENSKPQPTQTGMDGWMDDCYKNPNFIFLRDCGVMNDGVAKELMVLARSTLEYQWALVKKSTIEDIGKPGLLVSNLRKVLAAEAAKQQAAAQRAANPEAPQSPASAHPDAMRYQRPDFITEAEWHGLRDISAVYELLNNALLNEDGGIEGETFMKTTALWRNYGDALRERFAACVAARQAWQSQQTAEGSY